MVNLISILPMKKCLKKLMVRRKAPRCANDKGGLEWCAHTVDWSGAAGGQEDAALRRSAPPAGDNSLQGDRGSQGDPSPT